ncbi:15-hydroxyprostaglandin dehydrogenase [NAD(+)]-like [Tribolium castaneum]|uniref:Fat body protein 2-like Protein n=1 Tax=Tribolium castaneum TaxID=7070 RepID=D7EIW8_TRICA|nr:PREDICTED: 15-hydroxyprostaglandin dehydrogenase [NAD(+)]-like isoform X2 [Tribolium castaneum]EFA12383.1 Fat body protein 2-like Protein [Tribolium castaneum]|eukprot:XP_969445.1 PREDICTED: 15-hydroxyprostaglandin dehydrogenase [NAD(+)]-like isoform X2 [Tribolium castaneum]
MDSVKDKVALVTGGSNGIGLAIVKELLKNGIKGVSIVDISEAPIADKRVTFIKTDVTCKKQLQAAFDKTVETYNQLDIVVNNAGIVDEFDWKRTIDINLVAVIEGTYLALQTYLPKYKSGAEGVVVNTASVLGLSPAQSTPIYCTAKHGLVGLGQSLGGEKMYEKYKVRVLTICPGLVDTALTSGNKTVPSKILFPDWLAQQFALMKPLIIKPEKIGQALIEVVKKGKTGSVWVVEGGEGLYEVVVPDRKLMKA